jgi:hypothetical protein
MKPFRYSEKRFLKPNRNVTSVLKKQKKHQSENDSLLENNDFLVDFYIRKYCDAIILKGDL